MIELASKLAHRTSLQNLQEVLFVGFVRLIELESISQLAHHTQLVLEFVSALLEPFVISLEQDQVHRRCLLNVIQ